jgi:hypothetical protein
VETHYLCSDTMLNQHFSKEFKLIRNRKFNHLIKTLTFMIFLIYCRIDSIILFSIFLLSNVCPFAFKFTVV